VSPWSTGKERIEDLLAAQKLTRLVGADAGVAGHMSRARQQLESATLLGRDPVTAYVVADDDEAAAAIATSTQIVDSAERILEQGALSRF
jgi:hypothetical protein